MEIARVCQNCGSFIQNSNDLGTTLGVCIMDDTFERFWDEIMEDASFSSCYEMYMQKRYDGGMDACEQFEELAIIEIQDDEDIDAYLCMKHQNVDGIIKGLYDADHNTMTNAVSAISSYVYIGNESAYKGLIDFYMGLGPAESLEEVHARMEIVRILSSRESEKETIDAYINELARTPSNNKTRHLYTEILKRLSRCPNEMVQEPLLDLLGRKTYSYKIKNRILDVARGEEEHGGRFILFL